MRRKYRWSEWLGGEHITLIRGVHYTCSQSTFGQQLRNAAARRKLSISFDDAGDRFHVVIRRPAHAER